VLKSNAIVNSEKQNYLSSKILKSGTVMNMVTQTHISGEIIKSDAVANIGENIFVSSETLKSDATADSGGWSNTYRETVQCNALAKTVEKRCLKCDTKWKYQCWEIELTELRPEIFSTTNIAGMSDDKDGTDKAEN